MAGVLEGVKVLDVGHFVAVPSAGAILADWGAEVLKVEPLTGDPARATLDLAVKLRPDAPWRFEVHNRNKKSLAVDLKKESGRQILYKLVKTSDVFMFNYELDSLKRLQLDYATLSQFNPRLIYAVLTGYGTAGPDKDERGFDFTAAWARSGIQYLLGEPGDPPPQQRGGMMDRTAGMHMVAGVLAGLLHRERTGKGQKLEFSLYHSAVWTLAADLQVALAGQELRKHDRTQAANPLVNTYRTKDGRWLQLAMLQADLQWPGFCRAMGRPELENDPRFNNIETRALHCGELIHILDDIFASETLPTWETRLRENQCIYARIQTPDEVITDLQAIENHFFAEIDHPVVGLTKVITTPVKFCESLASVRTAAPEVGQHTEEVLLDLGYNWNEIAQLKEEGVII